MILCNLRFESENVICRKLVYEIIKEGKVYFVCDVDYISAPVNGKFSSFYCRCYLKVVFFYRNQIVILSSVYPNK